MTPCKIGAMAILLLGGSGCDNKASEQELDALRVAVLRDFPNLVSSAEAEVNQHHGTLRFRIEYDWRESHFSSEVVNGATVIEDGEFDVRRIDDLTARFEWVDGKWRFTECDSKSVGSTSKEPERVSTKKIGEINTMYREELERMSDTIVADSPDERFRLLYLLLHPEEAQRDQ